MDLILEQVTIGLSSTILMQPISLTIHAGETVTLMGPSGSGKSSLFAYIAGDLPPPLRGHGRVKLGGRDLGSLPPESRRIGRLFQDDMLFPHLTVGENLLFGMARGHRAERLTQMREALATAGLEGFENRSPHTLSGGQRTRVALFRALLAEPHAMLLDEPFAKLDTELRAAMRSFVFRHLEARRIPSLLVTHDRADSPAGGRILTIGSNGEVTA
ncbi:MAG: ATP-binding cassette domain-containing protein [Rhizobiales bacterium]|nr:ATP-binding cassette domain-containing protein [Hyphomicrobiales bacterium]